MYYSLLFNLACSLYEKQAKLYVVDHMRGWPEGSLFNSYYTEVEYFDHVAHVIFFMYNSFSLNLISFPDQQHNFENLY